MSTSGSELSARRYPRLSRLGVLRRVASSCAGLTVLCSVCGGGRSASDRRAKPECAEVAAPEPDVRRRVQQPDPGARRAGRDGCRAPLPAIVMPISVIRVRLRRRYWSTQLLPEIRCRACLWLADVGTPTLRLVCAVGDAPEERTPVPVDEGILGESLASGENRCERIAGPRKTALGRVALRHSGRGRRALGSGRRELSGPGSRTCSLLKRSPNRSAVPLPGPRTARLQGRGRFGPGVDRDGKRPVPSARPRGSDRCNARTRPDGLGCRHGQRDAGQRQRHCDAHRTGARTARGRGARNGRARKARASRAGCSLAAVRSSSRTSSTRGHRAGGTGSVGGLSAHCRRGRSTRCLERREPQLPRDGSRVRTCARSRPSAAAPHSR